MRSVDTNVVVRFLVDDGSEQHFRAKSALAAADLFVTTTVLLESEWVLRTSFRFDRAEVVAALRSFAGANGVSVENPLVFAQALSWAEQGLDLADAMHLAGSAGCSAFVSFDRPLARRAARLDAVPVIEP